MFGLKIEKVANGYIVTELMDAKDMEDGSIPSVDVIEENGEDLTEHAELEAGRRLLWAIMEHFGFMGSKHDEKRMVIAYRNQEGELTDE